MDPKHRVRRFLASLLDPMVWLHTLRLLHFYAYSHVKERRKMTIGPNTRLAPNVSIRFGERVTLGAGSHISEHCYLWAGRSRGRVVIGDNVLMAPDVFITASNYTFEPGTLIEEQERDEADVHVGSDTWLGRGVIVLPGVSIGDGCVVGAGSVVSRDLPANVIAMGVPAHVVKARSEERAAEPTDARTETTELVG